MENNTKIEFMSTGASNKVRFDKDKAYRRFLMLTGQENEISRHKLVIRILWQSAAVLVLMLAISYVSYLQGRKHTDIPSADIYIESPSGSKVKTSLPDGTRIWLNTDSKLTYSQGFGLKERKVYLNGEGYFEVTKNANLPFIVQTDELLVNVTGTKFNFQNYPEDREAKVTLLEGKVTIENHVKPCETISLEHNQKFILNKKDGMKRITEVTASNDILWTRDYLFFDEAFISDIAKKLERNFDVSITVDPKLSNQRFYGTFICKEQSIKDILNRLSATGKLNYSMKGKEIMLKPK